jgi:hypothetical protein
LIIGELFILLAFLNVISKKLIDATPSARKIERNRGASHKFPKPSVHIRSKKFAGGMRPAQACWMQELRQRAVHVSESYEKNLKSFQKNAYSLEKFVDSDASSHVLGRDDKVHMRGGMTPFCECHDLDHVFFTPHHVKRGLRT